MHAGSARAGALPDSCVVYIVCVVSLLRGEVRNLKARLHRVGRGNVSRRLASPRLASTHLDSCRGFGGDESDDDDATMTANGVIVVVVIVLV